MSSFEEMNKVLSEQKDFFIKNGSPSVELRIDRLQRLKSLIMDNRYDIVDALNTDFGNRSNNASMLSDVYKRQPFRLYLPYPYYLLLLSIFSYFPNHRQIIYLIERKYHRQLDIVRHLSQLSDPLNNHIHLP